MVGNIETYIRNSGEVATLPPEENRDLFEEAVRGSKEALDQFILANTRLITTALSRFFKGRECARYLIDDMFSEGLAALTGGVHRLVEKMLEYSDEDFDEVIEHWVAKDSKIMKVPPYLYTAIYFAIRAAYEKDSGEPLTKKTRQRHPDGRVTRKIPVGEHVFERAESDERSLGEMYEDILSLARNPLERKILKLRRSHHNDYEISRILDTPRSVVHRIRRQLYERFRREFEINP